MNILQIHNMYALRGGEETVVENERRLLTDNGHIVEQYIQDNKNISFFSMKRKISLLTDAVWSKQSYSDITARIKAFKPDVCHLHHFYPLLSPSVVDACADQEIPLVMTLHSYRLICTNSMLYRDEKVCTECVGKSLYHSVKRKCYRNSYLQTFHLAHTIERARRRDTWKTRVTKFIALTDFGKSLFVQGGVPEERIRVKPNFAYEATKSQPESNERYLLYFGRLDPLKGFPFIIKAAEALPEYRFVIAGDGPLRRELQLLNLSNIEYLGVLERNQLNQVIRNSSIVLFTSLCFEGMPSILPESFALGKPVLASDIGVMSELIRNGETGLLFQSGNLEDFTEKIRWSMNNPDEIQRMGSAAFQEYKLKFSPEVAYEQLIDIYLDAIETHITLKK